MFDVDGDGDLDFVGAVEKKMVWWKRAGGDLDEGEGDDDDAAFVKDGFTVDVDAEDDMTTVVALDIDADGDLDVVVAEVAKLTWYENDCTPVPTAAPSARPSYSPRPTHSFNPTPRPSISFNPTPRPTFLPTMKQFHCAENAFDLTHSIDTAAQANTAIFAIDLDGDYDVDFLAANAGPNEIAWYDNDGDEDFTKVSITDSSQANTYQAKGAKDVFAIDVDGDGDVDVLSASFDDDKIAW